LGRFVVGLRALLIPLAGSAGLPYGRFLVFDAIGALLWSALFIAIGFTAGQYAESLGHWLRGAPMLLGAALAAVLAGSLTVKLARRLYGLARGRRAPGGSCQESVAQGEACESL
jgi:membrane protein DedA with SNARE-associated domain